MILKQKLITEIVNLGEFPLILCYLFYFKTDTHVSIIMRISGINYTQSPWDLAISSVFQKKSLFSALHFMTALSIIINIRSKQL